MMLDRTQSISGGYMAGAHAYASLAQALKDGEKRLSVLRKVTVDSVKPPKAKTASTAKDKRTTIKK